MNPRILTLGAAGMSMAVQMQKMPDASQTILTQGAISTQPGGIAGALSIALARQGADVYLCARLGNDANGARLSKFYMNANVHTQYIAVNPDLPTYTSCHFAEKDTPCRTAIFEGAAATLTPSHIDNAFSMMPQALFMTWEGNPQILKYAASVAEEHALPVFLEISPVTDDIDLSDMPHVSVLTVNEDAAYALTGVRPSGTDSCLMAGMALQKLLDADYYIIRLGKRGAHIYDGIYCHSVAPFVVPVADSSGAGIAFNAALAHAYLSNGGDILEAARYGNAAGALTVQKNGLYKSLPTLEETEAFLRSRTR